MLRFANGEGKRQEWCNLDLAWRAVHSPTQLVVIPQPSPRALPLSQPVASPSEDRTPCSSSGHNTMEAWCCQRRSTHCATLCWWLIDSAGVLDNSLKLKCHMFLCFCVCVSLRCAVEWLECMSKPWVTFWEDSSSVHCQRESQGSAPFRGAPASRRQQLSLLHLALSSTALFCSQNYTASRHTNPETSTLTAFSLHFKLSAYSAGILGLKRP